MLKSRFSTAARIGHLTVELDSSLYFHRQNILLSVNYGSLSVSARNGSGQRLG